LVEFSELSSPLQEFKSNVTKPIDGLLPSPRSIKRRKMTLPSIFFGPGEARGWPSSLQNWDPIRLLKSAGIWVSVMKMKFSFKDASNYAKLFDTGLSSDHIAALVALFG
jgi:hypothetical protein